VKTLVSSPREITRCPPPDGAQDDISRGEPLAERERPVQPPAGLAPSEFASLYNEHSRAVYYLALRFLGDPQKAEDATHDVFLKAFRKMDQFRGDSSWRTWIYRITINHCRNLQQTWHHRHMISNADDAIWEHAAAPTDSPLRVLETRELGQRIQKALDSLPEEYRLLLLLIADEQLSYEQVATLTGQSADAVRGKLHRARKAFAVLFQQSA
jgi:RNA polymerase sigma-70 factor, ECF subfamily